MHSFVSELERASAAGFSVSFHLVSLLFYFTLLRVSWRLVGDTRCRRGTGVHNQPVIYLHIQAGENVETVTVKSHCLRQGHTYR